MSSTRYRSVPDCRDNLLDVRHDFFVRKAQDPQPQCLQMGLALFVSITLVVVNRAIYLDNEAGTNAIEVDDEFAHGVLAAKLEPAHLASTQALPQQVLSKGRRPAHPKSLFFQYAQRTD